MTFGVEEMEGWCAVHCRRMRLGEVYETIAGMG